MGEQRRRRGRLVMEPWEQAVAIMLGGWALVFVGYVVWDTFQPMMKPFTHTTTTTFLGGRRDLEQLIQQVRPGAQRMYDEMAARNKKAMALTLSDLVSDMDAGPRIEEQLAEMEKRVVPEEGSLVDALYGPSPFYELARRQQAIQQNHR